MLCTASACAQPLQRTGRPPGGGGDNVAGRFDYYVLSLSWSPHHCATHARQLGPDDTQCGSAASFGFVVHGLWPQYTERGYPEACTTTPEVGPDLVKKMMPIMPSERLIQHEWQKHGTCSGLPTEQYFQRIEEIFLGLRIPARYQNLIAQETATGEALRKEFMTHNQSLPQDGKSLAVICDGGYLSELRLCYSRDFQPQACSTTVQDSCPSSGFSIHPRKRAATPAGQ